MKFIFVYGTLMKGFHNNHLLRNCTLLKEGRTAPNFTMISMGGFPGVIDRGDTPIEGEVWEVTDAALKQCDRLEGHPDWYKRTPITLEDGTEVETYIYQKAGDVENNRVVKSGSWRQHTTKRSQA